MLLLVSRLGGAQPLQRFADGLVNDRWGQDISLEGYQDLAVGSFHGCFETVGTHRGPTRVVIPAGVRKLPPRLPVLARDDRGSATRAAGRHARQQVFRRDAARWSAPALTARTAQV